MGGIFGVCSKGECGTDLFFGTDYHSHLGTRRGGMAVFDGKHYNRAIHNIENSPFRTKFESDLHEMAGFIGVGCISDGGPQPIIINSKIGTLAVVTVGRINNKAALAKELIENDNIYFTEMSSANINDTELVASLICRKDSISEGIQYAQEKIEGSMSMLVSADGGIYVARDKLGRTPMSIGKKDSGESAFCASLEPFAYINMGYKTSYELGAGEVVFITDEEMKPVVPPKNENLKMCTFLWMYYGFPSSDYEGINVEQSRYKCGESLAKQDLLAGTFVETDYVAGIPDSGTAHAIGYANQSKIPFARPLVKYTPTWSRSFTPKEQSIRSLIATMKLVPVGNLIENKKLMFIEDSIVRGTQMRGLMDYLFASGAKEVHGRIASPPVLFDCKYLNFTRSSVENETISRQAILKLEGVNSLNKEILDKYSTFGTKEYKSMVEEIRANLNFTTLEYHSLENCMDSVGVDKCKLCSYCWSGKE